ncbi:hypothetical protein O6H91_07G121700 [Diphasiastrum complanatum]|uniref:Uncharacterized protein n=1 Tax=Diphasiastrum complanatum TaxID=34168 RepID=A0ACC2D9B8_DIPCM|nr:hypothetical protein O6H91_07G121700 [Diphasiastrum complanatum]
MEWVTTQHLDLRPMRSALQVTQQQQPQCGAFHHSQALFAAAVGNHITEFDALTGCKLSSIDIGGIVVRMAYSPAGGHLIIAVLEVSFQLFLLVCYVFVFVCLPYFMCGKFIVHGLHITGIIAK